MVGRKSKSAKYYANNPAARKKKAATDKKINARPAQKKKRAESNAKRREAKKKGQDIKIRITTTQPTDLLLLKLIGVGREKEIGKVNKAP